MSARLLAACCLLDCVVVPALGLSTDLPESPLVVYLSSGVQPERPLLYMKLELARLMRSAGYHVEWSDAHDRTPPSTDAALAVVELRGTCELSNLPSRRVEALASTPVSDGRILPYSSVDCASLTRMLAGPLANEPGARRDFLYGRAMARVLAHELYHVLAQTGDHSHKGIARAGFSANDLVAERLEFEQGTLAKLRPVLPARWGASAGGESCGR
jgi:hypothetical protein